MRRVLTAVSAAYAVVFLLTRVLNLGLTPAQKADLVEFLKSL